MDTQVELAKNKPGQQLDNAKRIVIISKMVDLLSDGYISTYELGKRLKINRSTVLAYRPLADDIIGKTTFDRNVVRNLQLKRTYNIIELLMEDLKTATTVKDRSMIYGNIYKFSSHLALITGLNVETHVNVDPTKLVIIRANQKNKEDRQSINDVNPIIEAADPQPVGD